ncbi:hypothetical protein GCM10027037_25840 [Mucilaginibacter koreensis]
MKKLSDVLNPFVLLLVPVIAAVLMGLSYELHQQSETALSHIQTTEQAVPLFYKGVNLVKTVCTITKDNVW